MTSHDDRCRSLASLRGVVVAILAAQVICSCTWMRDIGLAPRPNPHDMYRIEEDEPGRSVARAVMKDLRSRRTSSMPNAHDRFDEILQELRDAEEHERDAVIRQLANELSASKLDTHVSFTSTPEPGATVKLRLYSGGKLWTSRGTTDEAELELPIGIYYVWCERDGRPTSDPSVYYRLVKDTLELPLQETGR